MSSFQQARIDLGMHLRQLREGAQLSGKELAERLGWQASKVSRLENARQTASEEDVVMWAQAVDAAPESTKKLIGQVIGLAERHDSWRQRHRSGLAAIQEDMRDLEARTHLFRVFEPGLIIGLLQTAEYARNVFAKIKRIYSAPEEIDSAIRVRMQRQEILYDGKRRFRFLMPEAALRYRLAPIGVMRGQLDRLLAVSTLPNVEFGIIPFEAPLPSAAMNGFWLYDDVLVGVSTRTKELMIREAGDIEFYSRVFDEYCEVASFRDEARAVIVRILDDFAQQTDALGD
ncbi:helix-turn-helix transcriptional regulator [Spongiactinospora sp. TRM90649]|uniref:helix-turn-helix domain-containing protein n=1 Tax=Spongiactinospora sp. TRM90649 TaxID=3031114 RepID=UPI0023F94359|nr:helix-turn-helix transcriptional regulator [Spongiactinospora sp. TRM90649]MDF5752311.1 helix-turn-helix transcriptional regulator [Spongiactinospora sp. TRM90649]